MLFMNFTGSCQRAPLTVKPAVIDDEQKQNTQITHQPLPHDAVGCDGDDLYVLKNGAPALPAIGGRGLYGDNTTPVIGA